MDCSYYAMAHILSLPVSKNARMAERKGYALTCSVYYDIFIYYILCDVEGFLHYSELFTKFSRIVIRSLVMVDCIYIHYLETKYPMFMQ